MQLGYDGDETGGINEAYSDIWAACVQGNWQIGGRVMKNGRWTVCDTVTKWKY